MPSVSDENPGGAEMTIEASVTDDICCAVEQSAVESGLPVEFFAGL